MCRCSSVRLLATDQPKSITREANESDFQRIRPAAAAAALAKQFTCDAVNDIEVAIIGRCYNVQALVSVHQTDQYHLQEPKPLPCL